MSISITNIHDKCACVYKDLSLGTIILNTDIIYFAEFAEEILHYYNDNLDGSRIDFSIDPGTIAKYNLPFDSFNITLYRTPDEIEVRNHTSNYMYTEFEDYRNLWVDLYYYKDEYDSDKVAKDIMREINNFMNRDFDEYLNS